MVIPPRVGRESDKEFGLKLYVEKCFTENLVLGGSLVSCNSAVDRDVEVNAGHSSAVEDDDDVNRQTMKVT